MSDTFKCELTKIRNDAFEEFRNTEEKFCLEMEELWLKMFGKEKEITLQRYNTIHKHLNELFFDMLEEERESYQELHVSILTLLEDSKALQSELSINIKLPFEVDLKGSNLKKQKEDLENYLKKYQTIRNERVLSLEQYKKEEEILCSNLGNKPLYRIFNGVPSETKLKEIKAHLHNLRVEKETRYKVYLNTISEINKLLQKLEISAESNFEKDALRNNDEFSLTTDNINKLLDWKIHLVLQDEAETKLITELKEKISLLWDRLDIDSNLREQFLMKITKSKGKSLKELLLRELSRCEEFKKLNIETVILRLREDILDLWDRCHASEEERNEFTDFYCIEFNEELLELHEQKVESLQQFYSETSNLYGLAEKWFELWNKMISLENQGNNAGRLNNRGGQLLKEERERKKIQKELPKVQIKLEKLIDDYESKHNTGFLYSGKPLMQLISSYWDNRRLEKENEKEVRKIQNATRVTPLKASSNRALTGPSPASVNTRKRGRPLTPVENIKVLPVRRELKMLSSAKKQTLAKRRSKSQESLTQCKLNMNLRSASANSSIVSYAGFQNYIESKSKHKIYGMPLRSSLSPTGGLKTGSILRTPSSAITTPLAKRSRLAKQYSNSKLPRPMIN